MYCRNCGKQIDDNADVCKYCGRFTNDRLIASDNSQKISGSLIPTILMLVYTILLFIPIVYSETYWCAETPGVGIYSKGWTAGANVFSTGSPLLAVIVTLLSVLSAVVLVSLYLGKKSDLILKGLYLPIVIAVVYGLLSIVTFATHIPNGTPGGTASAGYYGYIEFGASWGFYINSILLIVACIMCIKLSKEVK
ncbi:MAG: zinc ribbon domain-containing protein [Saccharofermentans sp.]|nr:zinc ribbon domain-containing protein [Saccharofermentans sp.]